VKTTREETGQATDSMLENYKVLTDETVPALNKRVAELEIENERLKLLVAKLQPKKVRQAAKRKKKP
jgi:hypothetical protein